MPLSNRARLAVSFSGGRSSAVMLRLCLEKYSATHEISILFANTGCEHEDTLRFVNDVDRYWASGQVVWIEAIIGPAGVGPRAKIVTYETAARNGEPFEAAIAKHGVFGRSHPQCTSRLKEEPMIAYRRSIGWEAGSYETAIGIRADEIDRVSSRAEEKRFVYPLIHEGIGRAEVNRLMSEVDWDLNLPSDAWGNCTWCWKKSLRKLYTLANADPKVFEFPSEMEHKYGTLRADNEHGKRVFFRGNRSTQDIIEEAKTTRFKPYTDRPIQPTFFDETWDEILDSGGGCGDSCEIGIDE